MTVYIFLKKGNHEKKNTYKCYTHIYVLKYLSKDFLEAILIYYHQN